MVINIILKSEVDLVTVTTNFFFQYVNKWNL